MSAFGNALGSVLAFWIGRYLVQEFIEAKFANHWEFQRLKAALKRKGWKVILFARLSPVFPFSIGNYAFGTTAIKARHYFFASLVGTMPSTFVYTYVGFVTGDLAALQNEARERTPLEWGLLILGLIATVGLAWYLRRLVEKETEKY